MLCISGYTVGAMMEDEAQTRAGAVVWTAIFGLLPALGSMLWLHASLALTRTTFRARRALLACGYVAAMVVMVAGSTTDLVFDYPGAPLNPQHAASSFPLGPLYWTFPAIVVAPLVGAEIVFVVALRRGRGGSDGTRPQLQLLMAGTGLFLLGTVLVVGNAIAGLPIPEGCLQPSLAAGALVTAYAFARFPGLVEGQLLWSDLKASLLGTAIVMTLVAALIIVSGGSHYVLAASGWLVLVAYVFNGQLRSLADRPFFAVEARADRADLITAARFAGGPATLDLSALSGSQSGGLVDYASEVERAGVAWERLRFERDLWMELLDREEFAAVRRALGVPADWTAKQPFPAQTVREAIEECLKPRERLVIGLKYLGYSDREMADVMGVKVNVPRSYLSDAKAKLGLSAGPSLMLFAHFSGVVSADALPDLRSRRGAAASAGPSRLVDELREKTILGREESVHGTDQTLVL